MAEPITRLEDARDRQPLTAGDGQARAQLAPLLPAAEPVEQLLREAQYFVPGGTPSPDSVRCTTYVTVFPDVARGAAGAAAALVTRKRLRPEGGAS